MRSSHITRATPWLWSVPRSIVTCENVAHALDADSVNVKASDGSAQLLLYLLDHCGDGIPKNISILLIARLQREIVRAVRHWVPKQVLIAQGHLSSIRYLVDFLGHLIHCSQLLGMAPRRTWWVHLNSAIGGITATCWSASLWNLDPLRTNCWYRGSASSDVCAAEVHGNNFALRRPFEFTQAVFKSRPLRGVL